MEEWKDIKGFEGLYKISNKGRVWSVRSNKEKIPDVNNCGYKRIQLSVDKVKTRFFVHRLVAEHFLEGYLFGSLVNHKDLNKQNNDVENLEWVNEKENCKHAFENGHIGGVFVKKPYELVFPDGRVETFDSIRDCGKLIGYGKSTLYNYLKLGKALPSNGAYLRCVA